MQGGYGCWCRCREGKARLYFLFSEMQAETVPPATLGPLRKTRGSDSVVIQQPIMVRAKISISKVPVSHGYKSKISPLKCPGKQCCSRCVNGYTREVAYSLTVRMKFHFDSLAGLPVNTETSLLFGVTVLKQWQQSPQQAPPTTTLPPDS